MHFNCQYEIKFMNKYTLTVGSNRRSHGSTYFQLGIKSVLFSLLPANNHIQPTNDGLVLKYKPRPLEIQMYTWKLNRCITTWFDVPLIPIYVYNSFFKFCSRHKRLFCNQLSLNFPDHIELLMVEHSLALVGPSVAKPMQLTPSL